MSGIRGVDEWMLVNRWQTQKANKRWDHKGVTTMFVSNVPDGVNKETIRKTFSTYGEITNVYMATKRDSKKKNFAFVRFRKVNKEWDLEASLQSIKCSGSLLEVNIAKFERKVMDKPVEGWKEKPHNGHKPAYQSFRDGRSFVEAATGRLAKPPPPPPPLPKKTGDTY
ncbi:polyadenylate-binding protein, cytoplasmic and nuclear-like [Lactuca sativa]|uniref:polyadenylate-binding protein, cytoplasmic and nuclear-like n=1 Tax=Lactuca sativa TaxID=4236 RepID=UPI000CD97527|nr:polyadenylate-binding protein, cytoplasmic and nuclear-like [Lactuca sativa]